MDAWAIGTDTEAAGTTEGPLAAEANDWQREINVVTLSQGEGRAGASERLSDSPVPTAVLGQYERIACNCVLRLQRGETVGPQRPIGEIGDARALRCSRAAHMC